MEKHQGRLQIPVELMVKKKKKGKNKIPKLIKMYQYLATKLHNVVLHSEEFQLFSF